MMRVVGSAVKSICGCFGRSESSGVSGDEDYRSSPVGGRSSPSLRSSGILLQTLLPRSRGEEEHPRSSWRTHEDSAEIRSICREDLAFKFERACGDPNGPEARELREAEIWVVKAQKPAAHRSSSSEPAARVQKQSPRTTTGRQKHDGVTRSPPDAASVGNRLMRDSEAMSRASAMAENAFSVPGPDVTHAATLNSKPHVTFQDRCRSGRGAGRGLQGQYVRERTITTCIEE